MDRLGADLCKIDMKYFSAKFELYVQKYGAPPTLDEIKAQATLRRSTRVMEASRVAYSDADITDDEVYDLISTKMEEEIRKRPPPRVRKRRRGKGAFLSPLIPSASLDDDEDAADVDPLLPSRSYKRRMMASSQDGGKKSNGFAQNGHLSEKKPRTLRPKLAITPKNAHDRVNMLLAYPITRFRHRGRAVRVVSLWLISLLVK